MLGLVHELLQDLVLKLLLTLVEELELEQQLVKELLLVLVREVV